MSLIVLLVLALAPGLFWLWFFLRGRAYRPNPRRLLVLTFFLGMLSVVPAALLEFAFLRDLEITRQAGLATSVAVMLFVVGPVEESCKFLVVRLVPYRSLYFDEPLDGLIYSAAASLGFASLENLLYMADLGPTVIIVRGPISTLAHLVFGAVWGYALGWKAQKEGGSPLPLALGLAVAAGLHGLFNIAALTSPLLAIPLVVVGAVWVGTRFDWAQRVSPFRLRRNYPLIECAGCGRQVRATGSFCRFCGAPTPRQAARICSFCGARSRPDAAYCARCGDRFLT